MNIDDLLITDYFEAPTLTTEPATDVNLTFATLNADVTSDGGKEITVRGFKYSTDQGFDPQVDGIELSETGPFGAGPFSLEATGLTSGTTYYFRAFAINEEDTTFGAELSFSTPSVALTEFNLPYEQNFSGFTSAATLPEGWSINSTGGVEAYQGDWGSGTAGGLRGNDSVLGYQHTGSSGIFTATLTLLNNTGATIRALDVSYLGRVARVDQTRFPAWTVTVAGQVVEALAYSTEVGEDQTRSAIVQGLDIPDGQVFTLSWASDRGTGTDASRQIGISDVSVAAIVAVPQLSVQASEGPFFEDLTLSIENFGLYETGTTSFFYTINDSDPADVNNSERIEVTNGTFTLPDGQGALNLRLLAIDDSNQSAETGGEFVFPLNVASIQNLRSQPTGNTLYRLTSEATLTGQRGFRNAKFFQDESGFGIQIDDPLVDGQRVITTTYAIGDRVGSLIGTLATFQGQLRLTPVLDPGDAISSGNVVTPVLRTLADITTDDQARLIIVENVEFQSAGSDFPDRDEITNITDPSIEGFIGRFRMVFDDSDLAEPETKIPSGPQNVVAIVQQSNVGLNIAARNLLDFDPVTKSLSIGNDSDPGPEQQGWRFISAPVQGASFAQLLAGVRTQGVGEGSSYPNPAADPNVITLNQNQQYVAFNSGNEALNLSSEIPAGTAVGVYLFDRYSPDQTNSGLDGFPKTFTLEGLQHNGVRLTAAVIQNGNGSVPALNTGSGNFSLAGNPFNATLRFGELERVQLAPVVYAYDFSTGAFVSYSTELETGGLTDGLLGPFQGFFVQATGEAPELGIPLSARTTETSETYFRAPQGQDFRLQLVAAFQPDQPGVAPLQSSLWLGTHPEGGFGETGSLHDALRLYPLDYRPFLTMYTTAGGRALSIRALAEEVLTDTGTVLPVYTDAWQPGSGGYVPAEGLLSLRWPRIEGLPAGVQLLLEDTHTGTFTDLTQAGSYTLVLGDADLNRPLPPVPPAVLSRGTAEDVQVEEGFFGLPAPLTAVPDPQQALHGTTEQPQPRLRLHLLPAPLSLIPGEETGLPQQLSLAQNYPNPFNPVTQIQFELPAAAEVRLEIFNVQGQRVATLHSGPLPAGRHISPFDASALSSGVYLYRLQTGNQVLTRKMTLIK
ncbi:T9SS type A sorting domain-containing protein [Cyclonatronum proteinivorum]|nr:T9SS type A sorting domain-containing protein [Cyclonatronum proteinivorum]